MHTAVSHGSEKHGPSLLEIVAAHEGGLMEQVARAEEEARALLDAAHAEATAYLTEDYAHLEREVADIRRKSSESRDVEVAQIKSDCEAKVAAIRAGAASKLENVFREAVRRVLP